MRSYIFFSRIADETCGAYLFTDSDPDNATGELWGTVSLPVDHKIFARYPLTGEGDIRDQLIDRLKKVGYDYKDVRYVGLSDVGGLSQNHWEHNRDGKAWSAEATIRLKRGLDPGRVGQTPSPFLGDPAWGQKRESANEHANGVSKAPKQRAKRPKDG